MAVRLAYTIAILRVQYFIWKIGGHLGRDKTYEKVRKRFWWPRMVQDVRDFIAACDASQRNSNQLKKVTNPLTPIPVPPKVWSKVGCIMSTNYTLSTNGVFIFNRLVSTWLALCRKHRREMCIYLLWRITFRSGLRQSQFTTIRQWKSLEGCSAYFLGTVHGYFYHSSIFCDVLYNPFFVQPLIYIDFIAGWDSLKPLFQIKVRNSTMHFWMKS